MADNSLEPCLLVSPSKKMKRARELSSDSCSLVSSTFDDDGLPEDLDTEKEEHGSRAKKSKMDFFTRDLAELIKEKCQQTKMTSASGVDIDIEDSFSSVSSSSSRFGSPDITMKWDDGDDSFIKKISADYQASKNYERGLTTIFRDARFFLMKSCNEENVSVSKAKGVWKTFVANQFRLNEAFDQCRNVILIFSVNGSGKFSGFARLASKSSKEKELVKSDGRDGVNWIFPVGSSQRRMGGVFKLDWISKSELPFTKTNHLFNPWNEGKLVKIGRDGIEIEPHVGASLCKLFPFDPVSELEVALNRKRTKPVKEQEIPKVSSMVAVPRDSTRPFHNKAKDFGKSKRHYDGERRRQPWHSDSRPFRVFNNGDGDRNSLRPSKFSMDHGHPYGNWHYSPNFLDYNHQMMGAPPMPPFRHPPPPPFDCFPAMPSAGPSSSYRYDYDHCWSNVHSRLGLQTRFKIRR
ncbi:unnamed protein product [Orchesella dallaii]|uniref:YTH domain-containing protein n=1 Tax=Orchesella dallaii TaxID=48710 RepID=A0ABP1RPS9_9HEXA